MAKELGQYLVEDYDGLHVVQKHGSKDYYGVFEGVCECIGYSYNGTCKHLNMIRGDVETKKKMPREEADKLVLELDTDLRKCPQVEKIGVVGQMVTHAKEIGCITMIIGGVMELPRPTELFAFLDNVVVRLIFSKLEDFYDKQKRELDKLYIPDDSPCTTPF